MSLRLRSPLALATTTLGLFLCLGTSSLHAAPQWEPPDTPEPPAATGDPGNGPIRAFGLGDFELYINSLQPRMAPDSFGFVYSSQSMGPWDVLNSDLGSPGFVRVNIRFDLGDNINNKGEAIRIAKEQGATVLINCTGTPYNNASEYTGPDMGGRSMPPWARSVPADMQLWADNLRDWLIQLEAEKGVLPDYVEVWNEVDRLEWWSGSEYEYFTLYRKVALTLESAFFGRGVELGGAGFASQTAQMDGSTNTVENFLRFCHTTDTPLDFISYHQYQQGSASLYFNTPAELRTLASSIGHPGVKVICSEWNLFPGAADSARGIELDQSHAAANFAVFQASASLPQVALDHNSFFMFLDRAIPGLTDFTGQGHGLLTRHGAKKPSYRVFRFFDANRNNYRLKVAPPAREYALGVQGWRFGNRAYLVVGNDVIEKIPLWSYACRERNILPGYVGGIVRTIPYNRNNLPTVQELMNAGLTRYESDMTREILPLTFESEDLLSVNRPVGIQIPDAPASLQITNVWRFDSQNNNPASRRNEFEPLLRQAQQGAEDFAWIEAVQEMSTLGIPTPNRQQFELCQNASHLADLLGVPFGQAYQVWQVYSVSLEDGRTRMHGAINNHPALIRRDMTAQQAGASFRNGRLTFEMEPNSVIVLELQL